MTSSAAAMSDHVDITRDNFEAMLPTVEKCLSECAFFAMDCEMTGLFVDGSKEEFLDDMNDRCFAKGVLLERRAC